MQLEEMRAADPTAKALVFSQFNSTIDWLKVKLEEHGFGFRTISGGMTLSKRTKVRALHLCPAAIPDGLSVLPCYSAIRSAFFLHLNFILTVHHAIIQDQLPKLASPLRRLRACYSMRSP